MVREVKEPVVGSFVRSFVGWLVATVHRHFGRSNSYPVVSCNVQPKARVCCPSLFVRTLFLLFLLPPCCCEGILSKVLKKIIDQSRPLPPPPPPTGKNYEFVAAASVATAEQEATLLSSAPPLAVLVAPVPPSDGGMPSSHAMSLGFIGMFTTLIWWPSLAVFRLPVILGMVTMWFYMAVSLIYRVQAKLHTVEQIAVGLVLGSSLGWMWFQACVGNNPWNLSIMDGTRRYLLDSTTGVLPWKWMVVPAVAGLAVVGSFERRLSQWMKLLKKEQ